MASINLNLAECEDERILQRVDSFGILIVVSTLITGFSIPTIDQAQLELTRIVMTIVFSLEVTYLHVFPMEVCHVHTFPFCISRILSLAGASLINPAPVFRQGLYYV